MKRTVIIFVLAVALPSASDVLALKNGDRLTGTMIGMAGGRITFATEFAGTLVVDRDAVASATTEQTFEIIDESGNKQTSVLTDALSLARMSVIRQNLIAGISFDGTWANVVDLAATVASGNSDTENFLVHAQSSYRRQKTEHQLKVDVGRDEADGVTTRDQLDIDYGFKWFFDHAWYLAANGEYFRDRLKGIDQRITAGASIGHQFWDTTYGALSAELGVSQVFEDLDGDSESNPAGRWALDFKQFFIGKRLELFHNHSVLFSTASDRGQSIDASTGLRYHFSEWLNANARVDLQHETKPPAGNDESDVTYAVGLGIRF